MTRTAIQGDFEVNAIAGAYGAEQCKLLRAAYKKRGWNQTAISVRNHSYSMGSRMNVEIKRPDLVKDYAEAARLANAAESIRRCEMMGEILSGGNRYVSFEFSSEALEKIAAPFLAASLAALEKAAAGEESDIHEIAGTAFSLNVDGYDVKIWGESACEFCLNKHEGVAQSVAQRIGVRLFQVGCHPLQSK